MTTRVLAIDAVDAQSMVKAAEDARAAEAKQAQPATPTVHVPSSSRVTFKGEQMTVETSRSASANLASPLRPGHVIIKGANGGIEMTLEAAKAAGLTEMIVAGADDVAQSFKAGSPRAQASAPADSKGESNEAGTLTGASESEAVEIGKAADALSQAGKAIGEIAVTSIQEDVAISGELPAMLPEGLTQEMVDTVSKGYIAQANTVLRDTGATVDTMMVLLNDNELKDARLATFRGDDAKLKELGGLAVSRLHSIPDDPALLKELTANWPADIQVVKRENIWWVESPTRGRIRWSEAVDSGKLRVQ